MPARISWITNNNDPRLDRLFKIADTKTGWRGAFFGDFDSKEASDGSTSDDQVKYCTIRFTGDMDLMIMSNWEVCFFMAEAYARAGRHADAKAAYEQGVKASFPTIPFWMTDTLLGKMVRWKRK